jgi:hypothetical protein
MSQVKNNIENLYTVLAEPEIGRKYLQEALASNNEQAFLTALYRLRDAIFWDITQTELITYRPE